MLCKPQTPSVAIGRRGRGNMRSELSFAIMSRFGYCRSVGTPGSPAVPGWAPAAYSAESEGCGGSWTLPDMVRIDRDLVATMVHRVPMVLTA